MRLRNPEAGTVVTVSADLVEMYLNRGWVDANAKTLPGQEPESDQPKRRGRPPKNL